MYLLLLAHKIVPVTKMEPNKTGTRKRPEWEKRIIQFLKCYSLVFIGY